MPRSILQNRTIATSALPMSGFGGGGAPPSGFSAPTRSLTPPKPPINPGAIALSYFQ